MGGTEMQARSHSSDFGAEEIFGRTREGLPLWFKPERFLEPKFEAEAFVADLRRFVPLDTLSAELEAHLATLKQRLVEVINEDYADFVSLSGKLVNVDGAVLRMQKPLLEVQTQLEVARGAVAAELEALRAGLARRQAVAQARALLELMQATAHAMSKVEKLAAEVDALGNPADDGGDSGALDARARMAERLAGEVARLNFHAARGQGLPFVEALEGRRRTAAGRLAALLGAGLAAALRRRNASARQHCLQAYAAVGDAAGAEQVVRAELVAPLVAHALAEQKAARPRAGGASADGSFPAVLAAVADAVEAGAGPLLEAALAPQSGLHAFNLLANAVLAEIDEAVAAALPGAYSPGVPSTFLTNYSAALGLLARLEKLCPGRAALAAFRGSAAHASFLRRWKLGVYASLRFQEIAGAVEAVLVEPGAPPPALAAAAPNELGLQLQAPAALHAALLRCTAPDVWVHALADKLLRLALQLVARAAAWLAAGLAARAAAAEAAAAAAAGAPGAAPGGMPPPEAPAPPDLAAGGWAVGAGAEALARLLVDVGALAAWLPDGYAQRLAPLLACAPQQAAEAAAAALDAAAESLERQAQGVAAALGAELATGCAAALRHVRAVTATYRMTTRPPPSRPSHYAAGILSPLRAFLDAPHGQALPAVTRASLAQGVVAAVAGSFAAAAGDTLVTLRRTESSLRRLKKTRAGDGAAGEAAGLSDTDKVGRQLALDAQEYGRQAEALGVATADMPEYRALMAAVAPADL
ncbi:hypothetical protein WJX81_002272 [Elliptochloris bilobata]|uniref:Conserved oligomeric Golgi complex subunit 2 n=1 Tax=Elliptochloris bilobata TaxID=381761 RepID=A0AAW1QJF2_9CHLO